ADLTGFATRGDVIDAVLNLGNSSPSAQFRNFGLWMVEGQSWTIAELAARMAPLPLPAGLPMALAAFGGLALLHRRTVRP
ncbi:MAG: hypothetical protein Q4G49_18015, partial [Paracoccus sp. (in: a-proteobacteria)]|nr:hypothetical protein [Paracoccus sp. (in: a-proteobacteria)]